MPLIKHVGRDNHKCNKPNVIARRKENIGPGSIWQCDLCDTEWKLMGDEEGDYWVIKPPERGAYGMVIKGED